MSIIQYVILFIFVCNVGFTSSVNAEDQSCPMNHQAVMQEHIKEAPAEHDCCDQQLQTIMKHHECDGECAQCQTHCHVTVVILPIDLNLSVSINLQDIYSYHLPYYPIPTQSWLIPPIA